MPEPSKMLAWIPTALTVAGLVGGGAVGFYKIDQNSLKIEDKVEQSDFTNEKTVARDARLRLFTQITTVGDEAASNEEKIGDLQRNDIQGAGEIKLEILKLQTQQKSDKEAIDRQLDTILDLLKEDRE